MKVKELIKLLEQEDPEREVIIQKDSEGNYYSPCDGLWTGSYVEETTWYGEAWLDELTDELRSAGFTEDDVARDGELAIFLTPIN